MASPIMGSPRNAPRISAQVSRILKKSRGTMKKSILKPKVSGARECFEIKGKPMDPITFGGFLEFLRSSYCEENFLALCRILHFEYLFRALSPEERKKLAIELVGLFFTEGSPQEVNLPGNIVSPIRQAMKEIQLESTTKVSESLFSEAKNELISVLCQDTLFRYQTSSEFEFSIKKRDEFEELSFHPFVEKEKVSPSEWDILMTGSTKVIIERGEYIVKEGDLNPYVYRLISGSLLIEKKFNGKNITIGEINKPGAEFGEISFLSNLPSTVSIVARSEITVQRVHTKLMVYLCCSSADGPALGRKCLINMGTKLAKILVDLTSFETENMFQRSVSVESMKPAAPVRVRKDMKLPGSPLASLQKRFSSKSFSESVISSTVCWKRKKKSTLYLTPEHLLLFSTSIVQNSQVIIPYEDMKAIEIRNDFYLEILSSTRKALLLKMKSSESAEQYQKLIQSIRESVRSQNRSRSNSSFLLEDNFSLDSITSEEWDKLANNDPQNKKRHKYNCLFLPGEIILEENVSMSHQIYRLVSGSCEVRKSVTNPQKGEPSSILLGIVEEGAVFGEIGFLLGIRATATIVATSMVEIQIFDSYYLRSLFVENPMLILRFFYHVASNLANCINTRGEEGWTSASFNYSPKGSPEDKSALIHQMQYNRRVSKDLGPLLLEIDSRQIKVDGYMDNGILYVKKRKSDESFMNFDMFLYAPVKGEISFSLVKGTNSFTFVPQNDSVTTWYHRLLQASFATHFSFLKDAPADFWEQVKELQKQLIANVAAKMEEEESYVYRKIVLQVENILFYEEEKSKYPIAAFNALFGYLTLVNDTEIQLIGNIVVQIQFQTTEQTDEWLRAISNLQHNLKLCGFATFHSERVKESSSE